VSGGSIRSIATIEEFCGRNWASRPTIIQQAEPVFFTTVGQTFLSAIVHVQIDGKAKIVRR
jgi:hypothetical protein